MEDNKKQISARSIPQRAPRSKAYRQGLFTPKNPEKYIGDVTKIRYMSSWELEAHSFFDRNDRVIRWSSEPIAIPYIKPTDGKIHKYYPDYYVEYIDKDKNVVRELMECKPKSQTRAPRANHKHKLYEQVTFAVNQAKWAAAIEWCKQRGISFRVITENSIFR